MALLDHLFEPTGGPTGKIRCKECGTKGPDTHGAGWMDRHLQGHAPCPDCGRIMTLAHGRPRKHRCHPATPAERAITAVNRVLNDHRRDLSPTGEGWRCHCGAHFYSAHAFDHHRATLATVAAATILAETLT